MENRLRDLEYIQERAPGDPGRRIGAILLATLVVMGLTFAMGVVVGRAAKSEAASRHDPFAHLEGRSDLAARDARDREAERERTAVKREHLTFPAVLAEEDDRPEVAAALAAAAAEEAALAKMAHPSGSPAGSDHRPAPQQSQPAAGPQQPFANAIRNAQSGPEPTALPATLPAAAAAGDAGSDLARTAPLDPLVSAALRQIPADNKASPGRQGEFTLQVISYDQPDPAHAFAEGLRARGHNAFVVRADVPGRGRYYRVRIGPFKSRWKAELYRRKFEDAERMNTYVVRRPPPEA